MSLDRLAVAVLLLVTLSGVAVVYVKHLGRGLFVQLQDEQELRDEYELDWGRLQLEQSTVADISMIDRAARTRLQMSMPPHDDVVYVRP